jgi:hypothetical protein
MPDYLKDLESIERKILDVLAAAENQEMYLLALVAKLHATGASKSKATLRDAIMAAAGGKKVQIERREPKQLVVRASKKK